MVIIGNYTKETYHKIIMEVYVAHVARTVMSCHMYKIGGKVRLQRTGGPAGLRVTGTLARNLMGEWRRLILEKYTRWKIPTILLSRYVDDCSNVQRLLRVGTVWDRDGDKLKVCSVRRDEDIRNGVTEEQVTARVWRDIASSLVTGIKFTNCAT